MEELLNIKLSNGYSLIISNITDKNSLAVKLVNSNNEFVGQTFATSNTIDKAVTTMSNGTYTLTDSDREKIPQTGKSESIIGALLSNSYFD